MVVPNANLKSWRDCVPSEGADKGGTMDSLEGSDIPVIVSQLGPLNPEPTIDETSLGGDDDLELLGDSSLLAPDSKTMSKTQMRRGFLIVLATGSPITPNTTRFASSRRSHDRSSQRRSVVDVQGGFVRCGKLARTDQS